VLHGLPLRLFGNPRFTGAGLSITVLFFALSGVVFLSSQIYQFVLGYSPLAAGVRALPSAAALAVFSPVGAVLAGAIVVAAGLVVAFRAFRPARVTAEVPASVPASVPAEVPAEARVLEAARG